jgi:ADP-ribose pyrophosphatase YjhB (NUDIX family)
MLPRTIRLDASDTVVFARAAEPGEWAVPGTFLFWGRDPASLTRKEGIAFRSGFLGVDSFGQSTLVAAQPARADERAAAVQALARALVTHLGAPDMATALPAAEDEIAQAEALCAGHAPNTLIALHREWEGGAIRERFRTLRPRHETPYAAPHLGGHDRAFHVLEVDDEFDIRNPGGS